MCYILDRWMRSDPLQPLLFVAVLFFNPSSLLLVFLHFEVLFRHHVALHCLQLFRHRVQLCQQLRMFEIFLVIFHEHFSGFFVQRAFGERHDQQAFHHLNRARCTYKMLYSDQAWGFQSFFRVFTQISPFSETFGWKILVIK